MGRIVAQVRATNALTDGETIRFDALVDTGASFLVLPAAWRDRLAGVPRLYDIDLETADQRTVRAAICGPVRIEIEGFRPVHGDIAFVEMQPADGEYEPVLGYLPLEQAGIAVDMLGHRLVQAKRMDLKRCGHR
jgi:predicted aspartyl protease